MRCEFCETDGPDVTIQQDPFAAEVNDEDWRIPLCTPCLQARADDA